jgi:iron complex outermembrane recepter protein
VRRKLIPFCLLLLTCALVSRAQGPGSISGKVTDASGSAIASALVSAADLTTGATVHTSTGTDGQFTLGGLVPDQYLVTVEKSGFHAFTQRVSAAGTQPAVLNVRLTVETLAQSVVVRGTVVPGARPQPTRDDVLLSDQTVRVLDRKQLDAAGPVAGGAQMISYTPGANVFGYGNTGATKYTIQLNGIHQGWAGENTGFTAPGSLGITFDGVPISDVATGLWQSATMPQNLLMQNLAVTYGPGDPANRWYTNIGGQVEFTPVQPTVSPHISVSATYGSYGQKDIAFVLNTGGFHGWSTVIGGGVGSGDSYRNAYDGFQNHTKDGSIFAKTTRMFSAGSFELGGYYAKAGGFRPQVIPLTPQGILLPNGEQYSESSSGFYSTMPYAAYNKYDTNELWMIYSRENLLLNSTTTLTNMTWYMHIGRLHDRLDDIFASTGQIDEWNNPYSNAFGDEISMSKVLPRNVVAVGAYFIHELYNSHNNFYDPSLGGNGPARIVNVGGKFRSGLFNQDDVSLFAQDTFRPIPQISITPGIRLAGFQTGYSDNVVRDFIFPSGVIPTTHCSLYPVGADPFNNANATPAPNVTDQGSICGSHESRNGVEPSISASVMPAHWLTIYGGYSETYRSPSLGGGGGMFQKIDPNYYSLAEGKYAQVGFKLRFTDAPVLKDTILGFAYYHLDYDNQEIDFETATGNQISAGGSSTYHGVNIYFDDDPAYNLHIFGNFNGESSRFVNYVQGGPSLAECSAQGLSCIAYNNLPVSYTPNATVNVGVYYGISRRERVLIEPRFWYNYTGPQNLFNNLTGGPSNQTMPGYGTANLSFVAPIMKYINLSVSIINLTNKRYNGYEYISSGGYFGTPTGGYILAYPGAPLSTYGTISFQF